MKVYKSTFLFLLGLSSCDNNKTNKTEREGEPTIYSVAENDTEMNEAIKLAKMTLSNFNDALKSNNSAFQYFAIKTRLNTTEVEHIWVSSIILKECL